MSRRAIFWAMGALLAGSISACGPIQFITQVTLRAEKAVAAAKLQKADVHAPYEYWGAVSYLEQAKHRAGFGDFQTSYRYGKKSEKMAKKAIKLTRRRKEEASDAADRPSGGPRTPPRR